jgi:adenylate cyclase
MNKLLGATGIVVSVWILATVFSLPGFNLVEGLENKVWDFRVRATANSKNADPGIKIIHIRQETLDYFEKEYSLTWPFPRQIYSHVISFLEKAEAKGLAFDMLFTESSVQGYESDREFALSTGGALPVVSAVVLQSRSRGEISKEKFEAFSRRQSSFHFPAPLVQFAPVFNSVTLPIPELIEHSTAFGNVQANPDFDGIFRRMSLTGKVREVPVLSLPYSLYHITEGIFGTLDINEPEKIIRLHGASDAYQSFSLEDIVHANSALAEGKTPLIDPSIFKDTWVFLGTTAPGLLDLRPTSIDEKMGGLFLNATMLDNIIHSDFIYKVPVVPTLLLTLFLIILTVYATLHGPRIGIHILRASVLLGGFWLLSLFLANQGIWFPLVVPTISIMLAAFLGVSLQYSLEGRQHAFIRNAFKYYVSPDVVEQIAATPESLTLGGEKREISIFFSDIVGFTSISEKLDPSVLVSMLNEYLSLFTNTIQQSGGTVDKFVGDAVMAFWNAPLDLEDHGLKAVEAAIMCQQTLQKERAYFEEHFGVFPDTRIGLHTDRVSVGNFGSNERFNYTAIGDGVNLASRLEGANKNFGTRILISKETRDRLSSAVRSRFVADLVVLGKSTTVKVYEPLYGQVYDQAADLTIYHQAITLLEQSEIDQARKLFSSLGKDPVATAYLKKLAYETPGINPLQWNLQDK